MMKTANEFARLKSCKTMSEPKSPCFEHDDFLTFLRTIAKHSDWENLPEYLQDAIDRLLIDEAHTAKSEAVDFEALLQQNGSH